MNRLGISLLALLVSVALQGCGKKEAVEAPAPAITPAIAAKMANIQLEKNEANCKKINAFGKNDEMSIANTFHVSVSTVVFLGARWDNGRYPGGKDCLMVFDTNAGPKKCEIAEIMSDDGGNTAFAFIDPYNLGETNACF